MARAKPGVPAPAAEASLDTLLQSILVAIARPKNDEKIPNLVLIDGSRGLNSAARGITKPIYVLGAGRARLLRQMLTESLLLSSVGGAAGLVLGYAGRNALPRLISPPWVQPVFNGNFDRRVFLFTAGISILAGLLFGLAPASRAVRTHASPDLKDQAQNTTSLRKGLASSLIVGFQIALSSVLIVGATLFARTLFNLGSVDPGFRADHLLLFSIQLPPSEYPPPRDVILSGNIEERVRAIPGVESATVSTAALVANSVHTTDFTPLDRPPDEDAGGEAWTNSVGQGFFSTMGIPIIAGREFTGADTPASPKVAVINQTLARQYYPDTNPVEKTFKAGNVTYQIVGVSGDTRYDSLRKQPPATYYVLYNQLPSTRGYMTFEVRTHAAPANLVPLIREAVQSVDQNIPLINVRTQAEQIHGTIQQAWLLAGLTSAFGVLALLLACIGVYGVMAYTVARRTNEIGIRFALGAQTRGVLWMVLSEALRVTLAGIVVGLGAAFLLTGYLRAMLFGLKPDDPVAMVSAGLLLLVVSLVAAFIPALRASRLEPMQALRHD